MTATFDNEARVKMSSAINLLDLAYDGTPISSMVVKEIDCKIARPYIASFHYSHTMPDSTLFSYGAFMNDKLCGVACFGMGCGKNQYTALFPNIKNGEYVELTRLWCANDYPRNTESRLISQALKQLPKEIKVVISFADESEGHCGIIYQATNWYYLGKNEGGTQLVNQDGIKKHSRLLGIYRMRHPELKDYTNQELMDLLGYKTTEAGKKYRYVYLRGSKRERKELYRQIEDKILPYPKIDKKKGIDDRSMLNQTVINRQQVTIFDFQNGTS